MKKIFIAGIPAMNFGSNNYSYGLEAITFNPKDITPEQIVELEGCYLHPTCAPNSEEIFALMGTQEQYDKFYEDAIENHCVMMASREYDIMSEYEEFSKLKDKLLSEFTPWFK